MLSLLTQAKLGISREPLKCGLPGFNDTSLFWSSRLLDGSLVLVLQRWRFCLLDDSITLRVTSSPGDDFDGTTNITFGVDGIGFSADGESSQRMSVAEVDMGVTYYHCAAGNFWNSTDCQLCTSADMNGDEVRPNRTAGDHETHIPP